MLARYTNSAPGLHPGCTEKVRKVTCAWRSSEDDGSPFPRSGRGTCMAYVAEHAGDDTDEFFNRSQNKQQECRDKKTCG
ncbi:MAG: hypothetical protein U0103_11655 [Candidatus Obscuribacterales bacterium]